MKLRITVLVFAIAVAIGMCQSIRRGLSPDAAVSDSLAAVSSDSLYAGAMGLVRALPFDSLVDVMDPPRALTRTIWEGDSSHGVVHVVEQLHERPGLTSGGEHEQLAGLDQAAILRFLLARDARVVLFEGFPPRQLDRPDAEDVRLANFVAPGGIVPDTLTKAQRSLFAVYGNVPAVLQVLRPGTIVLGADSLPLAKRTLHLARSDRVVQVLELMRQRERVAMREAVRALERAPAREVFVVFGAAHRFDPSALGLGPRSPRLDRTGFPGLTIQIPTVQPDMVDVLLGHPAALDRYLDRLHSISPDVFSKLDSTRQWRVIDRPFVVPGGTGMERLRVGLVDGARTQSIAHHLASHRPRLVAW